MLLHYVECLPDTGNVIGKTKLVLWISWITNNSNNFCKELSIKFMEFWVKNLEFSTHRNIFNFKTHYWLLTIATIKWKI